jgi:hypothetical protein
LGKYWRSKPLVFSLLPRCQGLWGSQKKTFTLVSIDGGGFVERCGLFRTVHRVWAAAQVGSGGASLAASPARVLCGRATDPEPDEVFDNFPFDEVSLASSFGPIISAALC